MTLYSGLLLGSSLVLLLLALFASQQRQHSVAGWFAWLMSAAAIYCFGYAMELASSNSQAVHLWLHVQYLGIAFIPAFILLTSLSYQRQAAPPTWLVTLLLGMGTLTLALQWSNDLHHLFYHAQHERWRDGNAISQLTFGPWYYVHLIVTNMALLISCILFFRVWRAAERYYRTPSLIILIGAMAPWMCYLLYLFELSPQGIDLSPFGFIITGPLFAWGLFRYRFINLLPIAREQVLDGLKDMVLVLDNRQRIVDFNARARMIFPQLSHHAMGRRLDDLSPLLSPTLLSRHETPPLLALGQPARWFEAHPHPLQNRWQQDIGMTLLLQDVTERYQLQQQLKQFAEIDALTGLLNRRMILQHLALWLQATPVRPLSVLLFDIDNFKQLNDSRGHLVGDEMLAALAPALHAHLPQQAWFGRYGGDEFLILLPELNESAALAVANQLNHISQPLLAISLSIGVAQWHPALSQNELLHCADQALYLAKQQGRAQAAAFSWLENQPCTTLVKSSAAEINGRMESELLLNS